MLRNKFLRYFAIVGSQQDRNMNAFRFHILQDCWSLSMLLNMDADSLSAPLDAHNTIKVGDGTCYRKKKKTEFLQNVSPAALQCSFGESIEVPSRELSFLNRMVSLNKFIALQYKWLKTRDKTLHNWRHPLPFETSCFQSSGACGHRAASWNCHVSIASYLRM